MIRGKSEPAIPLGPPPWTPEIAEETEHLYERLRDFVPALEWRVHAPYIHAIEVWKRERNAIVLAHNYQTPEIFHGVADRVGGLAGARPACSGDGCRRDRSCRCVLHGRNGQPFEPEQDCPHSRCGGRLFSCRLHHRRRRAASARTLPGRSGCYLRKHIGRSEGGERHLLHLVERCQGRRVTRYGTRHLSS